MENFFKDGGVLIFIVEVNNLNQFEIYYSSLLPSDITQILEKIHQKNTDSHSINLEFLQNKNVSKIESVCRNFVVNRNRQMSIKDLPRTPIEEAKDLEIFGFTDGRPLDQYLLNEPQYLYSKKSEGGIGLFIDKINIDQVIGVINKDVKIKGEVSFSQYEIISEKNDKKVKLGNEIIFYPSSNKLTFNILGNLEEQKLTNKFLVNLLKKKEFSIGGQKISITNVDNEEDIFNNLSTRYSALEDTEALLKIFSIENSRFDIENLSESHNRILGFFINSMVYGKKILKPPFSEGISGIKIGNLVLGVILFKEANESYKILNLFDKNLKLRFFLSDGKIKFQSSPYIDLKANLLKVMDNFDENNVLINIKNVEFSELYGIQLNQFVLELIESYDDTNLAKFINTANEIVDWLILHDPENQIYVLNKFQIVRRLRNLDDQEIDYLIRMKESDDNAILCAINILLENKTDVKYYLEKIPEEQKKIFLDFPIYTLAKTLNLVS